MRRRLTISLEESVYLGRHNVIGRGNIGRFLENLARPYLAKTASLDAGYQAMGSDIEREANAKEWCDALSSMLMAVLHMTLEREFTLTFT